MGIEFELVELLLEQPHRMHESGSFEKGLVAFPYGVEKLVGEPEARRGWCCDEYMGAFAGEFGDEGTENDY